MTDVVSGIGTAWLLAVQAPGTFITAALILIASTYGLTRLFYTSILERRDAEIRLLEQRLQGRDAPIENIAAAPTAPGLQTPNEPWNTPEARLIRDYVKRVVEAVEDNETEATKVGEMERQVERIEASRAARWLENDLRQARRDFIRSWKAIEKVWSHTATSNPTGVFRGVFGRNEMERAELVHPLKDAAARLEAGLTGKPIPPAQRYGADLE